MPPAEQKMDALHPYVLEKCSMLEFIQHVLDNHNSPSWVIICSTREAFEERLTASLINLPSEAASRGITLHAPSIRTLASCSTLRTAFVPDLVHLKAFLASLKYSSHGELPGQTQGILAILAILDPVSIHCPTTAYSAQGLNRTFALAVDTAYALNSRLVIHESSLAGPEETAEAVDQWDHDVGIVDVRTKTFGPGSRGWAGRTVKLRHIAQRWMTFKQIERFEW